MKKARDQKISKRGFLKTSLGLTGSLMGAQALGAICAPATSPQPLGPFFPRPDTPAHPVKENPDPEVPIFLSNDNDLTFVKGRKGQALGQVTNITGTLTDKNCQPIAGATIIIWQASASGRYNHKGDGQNPSFTHPVTGELMKREHDPNFQYWGQATTNEHGGYNFKTIVPGFYPADLTNGWYRPPHIHFMISAMGHPQFVTQMYFRGDLIKDNDFNQELNQRDFLLQNDQLSAADKEALIVDFEYEKSLNQLVGSFDIQLDS